MKLFFLFFLPAIFATPLGIHLPSSPVMPKPPALPSPPKIPDIPGIIKNATNSIGTNVPFQASFVATVHKKEYYCRVGAVSLVIDHQACICNFPTNITTPCTQKQ